jgi:hypothetical protein
MTAITDTTGTATDLPAEATAARGTAKVPGHTAAEQLMASIMTAQAGESL